MDTSKPTAVFKPQGGGRDWTLSCAISTSVLSVCPTLELKTILIGQIARALAVFQVDEVVLFDDQPQQSMPHEQHGGVSAPGTLMKTILEYLETPQYLRRTLFPVQRDLRFAGILPSLDMPHHVRQRERIAFREAVITDISTSDKSPNDPLKQDPSKDHQSKRYQSKEDQIKQDKSKREHSKRDHSSKRHNPTVYVLDCGLPTPVKVEIEATVQEKQRLKKRHKQNINSDIEQTESKDSNRAVKCNELKILDRVTVDLTHGQAAGRDGFVHTKIVSREEPRTHQGYYWGYRVRRAASLSRVFTESPFKDGYDCIIGTSERGERLEAAAEPPHARHTLICFGGPAGLEAAVAGDDSIDLAPEDAGRLFEHWLNVCPIQGSRTIRTEEALWISLAQLVPVIHRKHSS